RWSRLSQDSSGRWRSISSSSRFYRSRVSGGSPRPRGRTSALATDASEYFQDLLTHFAAQHFAHGIARQGVHEQDVDRSLIIHQPFIPERLQPLLIQRAIVAHDSHHHALATPIVRDAEHDRFTHARAGVDHALDHLR